MSTRIKYLSIRGLLIFSGIATYLFFNKDLEKAIPFILIAIIFLMLLFMPSKSNIKDSNNNSIKKNKYI